MSPQLIAILVMLALAAGNATLGYLWQSEVKDFAEYRGKVEQGAKLQEEANKKTEEKQQQIVEDVSNAYWNQLPAVRQAAVDEYRRRFRPAPVLCPAPGVVLPSGGDPGQAARAPEDSSGGPATEQEQLACSAEIIGNCAEDALLRNTVREWALRLNLKAYE